MPDLIPFLVFCFNCPGSYLMYRHLETRPGARGPQNGNEPIATARQFVAHSGISEWHKKWKSSELLLFRWFIEKCKDNSFIVSILVIWISFAPLTRQIHQLTSLKGIQLYIINPFYIALVTCQSWHDYLLFGHLWFNFWPPLDCLLLSCSSVHSYWPYYFGVSFLLCIMNFLLMPHSSIPWLGWVCNTILVNIQHAQVEKMTLRFSRNWIRKLAMPQATGGKLQSPICMRRENLSR